MARITAGPSSEERRHQILEAALRVFADKGFVGATNKDIALEAGVTPGLIYHYFVDKRALFDAIFAAHSPLGGAESWLASEETLELEPRVVLGLLVNSLVTRMETAHNAPALRCLLGEAMHTPEMTSLFNANIARIVNALAVYLRAQMERGWLRPLDPVLVAQLLIGSLIACVMRRTITGDPVLRAYSVEQIAFTLVDMILDGLEIPRERRHDAGRGEVPAEEPA